MKKLIMCGVAAIFTFCTTQYLFKTSVPYQLTIEAIKKNEKVTEMLGEPIEEGIFILGSYTFGGDFEQANYRYSISGPKGEATVYFSGHKKFEKWNIEQLVISDSSKSIEIGN